MKTTRTTAKKKPAGQPKGPRLSPEEKKKRTNISLAAHHKRMAEVAGDGNVSKGIGVALESWASRNLKQVLESK
ncbi:MAG: hypothetical protein ACK51V_00665 [bacterium]|jgi:hypothetical protein|nr:hypothetical protein [Rhodocyclaceae bacterium]